MSFFVQTFLNQLLMDTNLVDPLLKIETEKTYSPGSFFSSRNKNFDNYNFYSTNKVLLTSLAKKLGMHTYQILPVNTFGGTMTQYKLSVPSFKIGEACKELREAKDNSVPFLTRKRITKELEKNPTIAIDTRPDAEVKRKIDFFKAAYTALYDSQFIKNPFSTMKQRLQNLTAWKDIEEHAKSDENNRTSTVLNKYFK